jgi:arylsulfatase A-like enzyme
MPILELLFARLASIEPGTMVFAHLALPHYPFAYHRDCGLRPDPSEWRDGLEARTAPRRNDARSRAERYPLYLDQVVCTHEMLARVFSSMQAAGTFDESVIIVHGDHGSRLDLGPPYAKFEELLSDTDYVDGFSTLFAVHWPSGRGLSDDRMIPLDVLLASVVREGRIPPGTDWMPPGSIYLPTQRGPMLARDMPEF